MRSTTKADRISEWLKDNGPATFDEIQFKFHGEKPNNTAVRNVEQTVQAGIYAGTIVYGADYKYRHAIPRPRRTPPPVGHGEMMADRHYKLGDSR